MNLLLNGFEQELTGWLGSSTRIVSVKDGAFPVFGFPLNRFSAEARNCVTSRMWWRFWMVCQ
jgi:hypothetical protein